MKCLRIEVYHGLLAGNTIWDIYQVGHAPILSSGKTPYSGRIIKEIQIENLSYTKAAFIYYEDGSMQYTEEVKNYYYEKTHPHTGQGEEAEV